MHIIQAHLFEALGRAIGWENKNCVAAAQLWQVKGSRILNEAAEMRECIRDLRH